ncbi:hypothetical protein TNCV_4901401 [Trichonephila clavipes]|nr:hypothetical protein TNCV_4901401 [Trichonephila clavipes]
MPTKPFFKNVLFYLANVIRRMKVTLFGELILCWILRDKSQRIPEVPSYQEDFDTLRMDLNDATINRSNTGQPHQSHMMRFSGNQQYNSQPRQFVQQNRHFNSPRNESNQRQG